MKDHGYDVEVYSDVVADPPEKYVLGAVEVAKQKQVCAVVGFGGGSAMDVAKLVRFVVNTSL